MRLQVSNNAVTGWLQLAGDVSIFIMNEQLYPVGCDLEGHARCLFMAFGHTAQLRCLHTACAKQSLCSPASMPFFKRNPFRPTDFSSTAKKSKQKKPLSSKSLIPCASRLTLVVKTRSRRGFHLNDIHVINPALASDARGDLSR